MFATKFPKWSRHRYAEPKATVEIPSDSSADRNPATSGGPADDLRVAGDEDRAHQATGLGVQSLQGLRGGSLRRVPRRALPPSAVALVWRVLHPGRVERRAPPAFVIPRELEVEALARHADGDVADAGPGVEPSAERPESAVVRGHRAPGEADGSTQELAARVEHLANLRGSRRGVNVSGRAPLACV
jgi:hypothetical protein